jgi:hypothetical protein
VRALGTLGVVVGADPAVEGVGQAVDEGRGPAAGEGAGGEGEVVLVDQHRARLGRHREGLAVGGDEEVGCRHTAEPLEHPPLVQAGGGGQGIGIGGAEAGERAEEPEAVTEVDQDRHGLALLVAPDTEGVEADLLVRRCVGHGATVRRGAGREAVRSRGGARRRSRRGLPTTS